VPIPHQRRTTTIVESIVQFKILYAVFNVPQLHDYLVYSNVFIVITVYILYQRHIDEVTEAGLSSFDALATNAGGGIPYTLGFPITADDDGLV
jgi:hypothetical protein